MYSSSFLSSSSSSYPISSAQSQHPSTFSSSNPGRQAGGVIDEHTRGSIEQTLPPLTSIDVARFDPQDQSAAGVEPSSKKQMMTSTPETTPETYIARSSHEKFVLRIKTSPAPARTVETAYKGKIYELVRD